MNLKEALEIFDENKHSEIFGESDFQRAILVIAEDRDRLDRLFTEACKSVKNASKIQDGGFAAKSLRKKLRDERAGRAMGKAGRPERKGFCFEKLVPPV